MQKNLLVFCLVWLAFEKLLGSNKKAGGGGKFSKLPIFEFWPNPVVLVMDEVRLIGGGGLLAWTDPRLKRLFLIVPVEYTAE